eukprot:3301272-Prymnesium_polylepis.1
MTLLYTMCTNYSRNEPSSRALKVKPARVRVDARQAPTRAGRWCQQIKHIINAATLECEGALRRD